MGKSSHSKNVCTCSVISNSSMNIQNETEQLGSREGGWQGKKAIVTGVNQATLCH